MWILFKNHEVKLTEGLITFICRIWKGIWPSWGQVGEGGDEGGLRKIQDNQEDG